mmetsp:Transcript_21266/g.41484  ORF Transcript_21266/g.41484 Transcript_21266/m.41484 type:complete len:108 (-) Transcript_21266:149-472(-)
MSILVSTKARSFSASLNIGIVLALQFFTAFLLSKKPAAPVTRRRFDTSRSSAWVTIPSHSTWHASLQECGHQQSALYRPEPLMRGGMYDYLLVNETLASRYNFWCMH